MNGGEFMLYAVLGVLAGATGVAFSYTLYWPEDRFDDVRMPDYLKPVPGSTARPTFNGRDVPSRRLRR